MLASFGYVLHLLAGVLRDLKHVAVANDVCLQLGHGDGGVLVGVLLGVLHYEKVFSKPLSFGLRANQDCFECIGHIAVLDQRFQGQRH